VFQIDDLPDDVTSLARACRNGNLEMVRWLVADVGVDPSLEADGEVRWDCGTHLLSNRHV
jgi:hypothetical protein